MKKNKQEQQMNDNKQENKWGKKKQTRTTKCTAFRGAAPVAARSRPRGLSQYRPGPATV